MAATLPDGGSDLTEDMRARAWHQDDRAGPSLPFKGQEGP